MHILKHHFHFIHIPPLLTVTLFFIFGIIWHSALSILGAAFIFVLVLNIFAHKATIVIPKQLILYSFFAFFGAYLHQHELRTYNDFYEFTNNATVAISGTVIDKSTVVSHHKKSTVITLAISTIENKTRSISSNKIIMIYSEKDNGITVGDTVTVHHALCKKSANESFQRYQIKEQIASTIFDNTLNYTIDNHPTWSLRRWIWEQKQRLLNSLAHKLSPNGFKFFSSLFLGNRTCIKEELKSTNEQFKTWGISHFLARSGLHLALFIFIWQAIFSVIPLPFMFKHFFISLLSCIYFTLTWTSAPFTRSFALFALNKLCIFNKKTFHLLHYLTLVCFCFLLYCPLYLFFLDFQLSFALTFALAWFNQLSTQHQPK
jgi:competence protein ComEC